ncbi:MAG: hypothetical protein I8H73_07130 [Pseudomonadales bacterium]|nr:hypothetical protein [Pseudomonadales bacterium]
MTEIAFLVTTENVFGFAKVRDPNPFGVFCFLGDGFRGLQLSLMPNGLGFFRTGAEKLATVSTFKRRQASNYEGSRKLNQKRFLKNSAPCGAVEVVPWKTANGSWKTGNRYHPE